MSRAFAYPELESAVAQIVTADAHPSGWEHVYGVAVRDLWPAVAAGRVPRPLAVQRITRALSLWTDEDEAAHFAQILPPRGWTPPEPEPEPEPVESAPADPGAGAHERPLTSPRELVIELAAFRGVKDRTPRPAAAPWSRLAERLTSFRVFEAKDAAPLWSPTRYRQGATRGKAGVAAVTCLVLDFDDGTPWTDVLPRWEGVAAVVHTSWSHTAECPKWRLVMPLARPVPGPKWGPVWAWGAERSGLTADEKCKDASRIYFVPAARSEDAPRDAFVLHGAPLEVPLDVLEPVVRRPNPIVEHAFRERAHGSSRRGDVFRVDADARRALGLHLGGELVSNGNAVKGVACPRCGRPSVSWWVPIGAELQARCNHVNSCGARFWLDELEGVR